jgi:hypothetical protein
MLGVNMSGSQQQGFNVAPNIKYNVTLGHDITDDQWRACAATFSAHYGVWSEEAPFRMNAVAGMETVDEKIVC